MLDHSGPGLDESHLSVEGGKGSGKGWIEEKTTDYVR